MAVSDAFVVVGEWLSEHYFTSDATKESFRAQVLARRKEWEGQTTSPRERFTAVRGELERRLGALSQAAGDADDAADLQADAEAVYDDVLAVLGYRTGEFTLDQDGPVLRVSSAGIQGRAPLAILRARPVEALEDAVAKGEDTDPHGTLAEPYVDEAGTEHRSAARALSALFVAEDGPSFALVLAGRWCIVAEAARWAEGRYLAVDLQTVAERNDDDRGGEIDRALTILEAGSLAPDADGAVWWSSVLEESVRHTVGVSEDLREGVRRSIEIIANDVVARRARTGLPPLPGDQAQPLAVQSLRYLYRILFLLYAEASPELGVLPSGAAEYDAGYSVDRLRELTLVELATEQARSGTHLYESLAVLSRLVDRGPEPWEAEPGEGGETDPDEPSAAPAESAQGLEFHPLRADLFAPTATALIDEVKLSNGALQQVLSHLLLSKERKRRDRGFISYAELGINQLGAVYEGLMSYTGFFAEEELYEVAPGGDASKGSWVVPVDRAQHLDRKDFVEEEDPVTHERRPVRHRKGTFVYRLSGRERQQSASYYTPEVLTRFTVGQALEELLDQDGHTTTAEEILQLTVCEPALGSGAFAIEAVDQLARQYLTRRQAERGERIDAEDYPLQLQRVKAHIALHQVYGVDLNATAVELAEVSLWLSTMTPGLQAPWFGLRLRRGNSLIGARRAVYPASDLRKDRAWMKAVPQDRPLTDLQDDGAAVSGSVFHFLLPSEGWGAGVEVPRQVRDLVPDEVRALKAWRASVRRKLSAKQVKELDALTQRAEKLWALALRRLTIAEQQSGRDLDLWGREASEQRGAVTREQIEASLADPDGAYRRLRRVMDAWCGLWFWPLTETEVAPPSMEQWIDALQKLLGVESTRKAANAGTESLADVRTWEELDDYEIWDRAGTNAVPVAAALDAHPWLRVCERVAQAQGFFHWELDFVTVFARGGFDLQVGNPPWVKPDIDEGVLIAEHSPAWAIPANRNESRRRVLLREISSHKPSRESFITGYATTFSLRAFVSDPLLYPVLKGLRPDLYRTFIPNVWRNQAPSGISALIHSAGHMVSPVMGRLRESAYRRLRRHFHFSNEMKLFEAGNRITFSVGVYSDPSEVRFINIVNLVDPLTAERSLVHNGDGDQPGIKYQGAWDVRPHAARVGIVTESVLRSWASVTTGDSEGWSMSGMVFTPNRTLEDVVDVLSHAERVNGDHFVFSPGWNETNARQEGVIEKIWHISDNKKAILQGPSIGVNDPLFQQPNRTLGGHRDWTRVDLEETAIDAPMTTGYRPMIVHDAYVKAYPHRISDGRSGLALYRAAWRSMADAAEMRTLKPALLPPAVSHVDGITAAVAVEGSRWLLALVGSMSSLLVDFYFRIGAHGAVSQRTVISLPCADLEHPLFEALALRVLRLNCLTQSYADLWTSCWSPQFAEDTLVLDAPGCTPSVGLEWDPHFIARRDLARRNVQIEIDVIISLMFGVSLEQLKSVYRSHFWLLRERDSDKYYYDANGRLVPTEVLSVWKKKGERITAEERTAVHPGSGVAYEYELPFATRDREEDFRVAYAEFQRRLEEVQG